MECGGSKEREKNGRKEEEPERRRQRGKASVRGGERGTRMEKEEAVGTKEKPREPAKRALKES